MKGSMRFSVSFFLALAVLLGWGSSILSSAAAQEYPVRTVEVIVPWGPGSNADLLARLVTPHLEKHFKQPFVVVNKTGGAGMLAHNYVAQAKPDGYTLLSLNSVYGGLLPTRKPDEIKWKFDSFVPIIGYADTHIFFHARKESPWKDLRDFLEEAKNKPGKFRYATYGTYSIAHIIATDVLNRAGVKAVHIPEKGSGDAMTALLGGHVDVAVIFGSAGHFAGGTIKVLAVCAAKRRPDMPDTPTLVEFGYPIARPSIVGLAVPQGTPREIVNKLFEGTRQILSANKEELKDRFLKLEAIPTLVGPEEYWEICNRDRIYFEEIIAQIRKELGARQ